MFIGSEIEEIEAVKYTLACSSNSASSARFSGHLESGCFGRPKRLATFASRGERALLRALLRVLLVNGIWNRASPHRLRLGGSVVEESSDDGEDEEMRGLTERQGRLPFGVGCRRRSPLVRSGRGGFALGVGSGGGGSVG